MADKRLIDRLSEVTYRLRRLRLWRGLAAGWLVGGVIAAALVGLAAMPLWSGATLGALFAVAIGISWSRSRESDLRDAARLIESTHPELDSRLYAAVDLRPDPATKQYGFLQMHVLTEALEHARKSNWRGAVAPGKLLGAQLLHGACFCLFLFLIGWVARYQPGELLAIVAPKGNADAAAADRMEVLVSPGNVEVEKGTGLLVTARFDQKLPSAVELVATDKEGKETRLPLIKSLDDPLFGARIPEVAGDLTYRVAFDGRDSESYQVTTFEYPRLEQADAEIQFPAYTGKENETQKDVQRIAVLEGSELTLTLQLNKPVKSAVLESPDGGDPVAVEATGDPTRKTVHLAPRKSGDYRLLLTDDAGRAGKEPAELVVTVVKNHPPDLKVAFPARDVRVSPLEELTLEGTASDDFGLKEHGLVYQKPDGTEESLKLGTELAGDATATMSHLVALEGLKVEPDNLLSFYFYADDVGPDGQTRRTFSDMFFAEVRPFEEIYRQGNSQAGQQQQSQQQQQQQRSPSQKVLELQRQIVSASWNLIRRETADPPGEKFHDDAGTIAESQGQAIELLEAMAGRIQDVMMQQYAEEAKHHMEAAAAQFNLAVRQNSIKPFPPGRTAAQAAYQSLLKLQAREHNVMNSQQRGQQSGQNSSDRMNRQLRALELKNDRRRYETERQAQQQQDQQSRESLQVLNRLRELAQRQEDLNERIRQVENQLRNAKTDAEKQDLERQLKRLQAEQQDLLRDADELRERMNREENRSRMQDARQALDKTRDRMYESSQSLKEGQTSRALAEGTRAQRELDNLKEEFRKQTAGRFDDAVRELREQARQLSDAQDQIGRDLGDPTAGVPEDKSDTKRQRPSLGAPEVKDRTELADRLAGQQEKLDQLLQRTRGLVEESETSEPLLSKRLYDTMRQTRTDKPSEALAAASEMLRRGFTQPAGEAEQQAREGIHKLRDGIDQAAEAVLGNEAEALRRAKDELSRLTKAIGEELAQNDEQFARDQQRRQAGEGASQDRRNGEDPNGEPQPGEDQSRRRVVLPGVRSDPSQQGEQAGPNERPSSQQEGAGSRQQQDQDDSEQRQRGQGGQPGERQPGESQQRSDQRQQGSSRQPGENPQSQNQQSGQQPGEGQQSQQQSRSGQQPGGQQPGQQSGQSGQSGSDSQSQQSSQGGGQDPSGDNRGQPRGERPSLREGQPGQQPGSPQQRDQSGGVARGGENRGQRLTSAALSNQSHLGEGNAPASPLTGEAFTEWSDRMREVEEMVGDPQLRAEAAAIRERARATRIDFKRHSLQPNWELVRTSIYGPMRELEQRLAEEIARRTPDDRLVPIDRDPVPNEYADLVKRYYEELSRY